MKILICDDVKSERIKLSAMIRKVFESVSVSGTPSELPEISCFSSGSELLDHMRSTITDQSSEESILVFLDCLMPVMNGMETGRQLHDLFPLIPIIFVTGSRDFAVEAFEIRALGYIVKPYTLDQVRDALERYDTTCLKPYITVHSNSTDLRLFCCNIRFIQSLRNKTEIGTDAGSLLVTMTLSEIEKLLPEGFALISRGFIVNLSFIDNINGNECCLKDGTVVLISRSRKQEIHALYNDWKYNH